MKRQPLVLFFFTIALTCSGCERYLKQNGINYWTTNSDVAELGAFGTKRKPKANFFEYWDGLPLSLDRIRRTPFLETEYNKKVVAKLTGSYSKEELASVGIDANLTSDETRTLKTVKVYIPRSDIKKAVESHRDKNWIASSRHRRVISANIVALEDVMKKAFESALKGNVEIKVIEGARPGKISLEVKTDTKTIRAEGYIVGYEMSVLYWSASGEIVEIYSDVPGSPEPKLEKGQYRTWPHE